jgi:hypothetical protein
VDVPDLHNYQMDQLLDDAIDCPSPDEYMTLGTWDLNNLDYKAE